VADKHPYMSGSGGVVQTVSHLRKSFPGQVTAETLKKLGIASNNESFVLNILRFVGVLDADGKKNPTAATVFNQHEDAEFQAGFAKLVSAAYADLFSLHGDQAWTLPTEKLISYFRNSDHTTALVGGRQASTFQALAALSGKNDSAPRTATQRAKTSEKAATKATPPKRAAATPSTLHSPLPAPTPAPSSHKGAPTAPPMALTVRVEINLPAGGDQETYDRIFKSIRENLLNGDSALSLRGDRSTREVI
jgi:hypothetical protein